MSALKTAFWASAGLLIYTQVGYGLVLSGLAAVTRRRDGSATWEGELPSVSVIVAAYAEEDVIAARVANLRALDYPAADANWRVALEEVGATGIFTSPTAIRALMKYGDAPLASVDHSRLERVVCAGEVLNPAALDWL